MQDDVEMMESYVTKYGKVGMTSVLHLKEAIVFLTEKPEILQQAVFVDILKRHKGKVCGTTRYCNEPAVAVSIC